MITINRPFVTISRTTILRQGLQKGFTLFEIMVVMVIISIVTGVTVLSFNTDNSPRELERESKRFYQVLRLLSDEAVLQNKEFGLEVFDDGYSFLHFDLDSNAWLDLDDSELFRAYLIPEKMRLALYAQDIPFELGQQSANASQSGEFTDDSQGSEEKSDKKPSVWFLSSGEVTPFEIEFSLQDRNSVVYSISANDLGELTLGDPNDAS
ncbi:MAG: type II secretion system protein GspH [Gammaproteobacteria bacterium]|nr:MAG: type II secretion system protein GspH [Gammaproteobacteria bacterium]